MMISPELKTLAEYMAGEFDNQAQALADPVWYVHLRLWHRPVPVSLFAEFGFEATIDQFFSHDKGIDSRTGKPLWGAMLGLFQFQKRFYFTS
ncbi:MAG: CpcT/CpeT family chromophore lyase [Planktothrix sp.]|uniref:CpcT/CpeT family chromophore lyase n=1 Tax=Planktothrix sp. TaxID=3088171 RepID=UPI0038D497EA